MKTFLRRQSALFFVLLAAVAVAAPARKHSQGAAEFQYVGGTQQPQERCDGQLALTQTAMIFECPEGRVTAPYKSIVLMEYRSRLSRRVRHMKLAWTLKPPRGGGGHNRFFTVVFRAGNQRQAMVLKVSAATLRPYLAELDLRVGRRVDVERFY